MPTSEQQIIILNNDNNNNNNDNNNNDDNDRNTGELGYDGPLYDGFLHMTDDMLGPSPLHIKYSSYVYNGFCI